MKIRCTPPASVVAPSSSVSVGDGQRGGFSLVEVTIAIGIFAFVIVGIVGLFPTALKLRNESALDTRSYMIAQQLFSYVQSAPSVSSVVVRDGPGLRTNNSRTVNLSNTPVVIGYQARTAMPYWFYEQADASWKNSGANDSDVSRSVVSNQITAIAKLSATRITNNPTISNLYQITVEVRSPASLPLDRTRPSVFTTFHAFPNN